MSVVTFENPHSYVFLILAIPGQDVAVHNTYPNCRISWTGDTLNIYQPDSDGSAPRASYHRSLVLLCEVHGSVPPWGDPSARSSTQPSQNGPQTPGSSTPTRPAASAPAAIAAADSAAPSAPTAVLPAIPPTIPPVSSMSSLRMRPVAKPNLGNGEPGNFPAQSGNGDGNADDGKEGDLDRDFLESLGKLRPSGRDRLDFPKGRPQSSGRPGIKISLSAASSSMVAPSGIPTGIPSGWSSLRQTAFSRSAAEDAADVPGSSPERYRPSGSTLARKAGQAARTRVRTHRRRYMDRTRRFFETAASALTRSTRLVARVSVMLLFTGWASEEGRA